MAVSPPMAFTEQAKMLHDQIDEALQAELIFSRACPSPLSDAIRYAGLGPGKRLRPILVLLAAEACGGIREDAMPAAVAVECIHAYSLVHDDLPAMDDDDLRRGRLTCHRKFDEPTAILAGDALLTRAFEILATRIQPAEIAIQCITLLARAAGAEGMVGGQMQDLMSTAISPPKMGSRSGTQAVAVDMAVAENERNLEAMHRSKTGALFVASLQLGGTIAGATESDQGVLRTFGEKIGLAFQIVDDLLDVAGNEQQIGKRVGKDDALGKLTFPGLLGTEQSKQRAKEMIFDACGLLEHFGQRGTPLRELANYIVERDS